MPVDRRPVEFDWKVPGRSTVNLQLQRREFQELLSDILSTIQRREFRYPPVLAVKASRRAAPRRVTGSLARPRKDGRGTTGVSVGLRSEDGAVRSGLSHVPSSEWM